MVNVYGFSVWKKGILNYFISCIKVFRENCGVIITIYGTFPHSCFVRKSRRKILTCINYKVSYGSMSLGIDIDIGIFESNGINVKILDFLSGIIAWQFSLALNSGYAVLNRLKQHLWHMVHETHMSWRHI